VSIFGEQYSLRAAVEVITGYSAHADRDELLQWVRAGRGPNLRQVFVVHGEEEAALSLARDLTALDIQQVTAPQRNDSIEL
jgi:metallo-beta-lactamase family protein